MWPRTVFFDVGNTLIYPCPPVGEVYARAMRRDGCPCSAEDMEQSFLRAWRQLRQEHKNGRPAYGSSEREAKRWWRRVLRLSFRCFGEPRDFDALFEGLWDYFGSSKAWRIYPDVLPALDGVKARAVNRGFISNWDLRLVGVLKGLGLWSCFETRVISFQVGCEKPDPRIFEVALRGSSIAPAEALHVGDSYKEDVLGAMAAGITPVWLRRNRRRLCSTSDTQVIGELTEVFALFR